MFGSSSDEYLDYAISNRRDWIVKGEEVVAEMLQKLEGKDWPNVNNMDSSEVAV